MIKNMFNYVANIQHLKAFVKGFTKYFFILRTKIIQNNFNNWIFNC